MTEPTLSEQMPSAHETPSFGGENGMKAHAEMPSTETFMNTEIKFKRFAMTPAHMLRYPGADIGLDMVTDDWLDEIIESDDPDTELMILIDNLTGVLKHLKLIRKHHNIYVEQSQQAAA